MSGSESTRTTRVFAGGAIIAEMRTITGYSDKMAYFHADPVTGSKQTVWQSGEKSTMLRDREEFEPLGQFVRHIAPPANENPPPNPAPVFNDAKFPEWQCKVAAATGKKNGELPSHCGSWEKSVWDRYPLSQKDEGNAAKVAPVLQKQKKKEEQILAKQLAASKKPSVTDNETFVDIDLSTPDYVDVSQTDDPLPPTAPPPPSRCPKYSELTDAQRGAILEKDYARLSVSEQASFLNVTALMNTANVDLNGLIYDPQRSTNEQLIFVGVALNDADNQAILNRSQESVILQIGNNGRQFSIDNAGQHPDTASYRQSTLLDSVHLSYGLPDKSTRLTLGVHVDRFGASSGVLGAGLHFGVEFVFAGFLGLFDRNRPPNPFKMAKRLKGNVKGALCDR